MGALVPLALHVWYADWPNYSHSAYTGNQEWSLIPVATSSFGFSLLLVALLGACPTRSSNVMTTGSRPGLPSLLSRLSLGMLVNHNYIIYIVSSALLGHESIPCKTYLYIIHVVGIALLAIIAGLIQW